MGNSPVPAGTQRPTSAPLRKSSRPGGRPSITRTHADGHCHKIQGMSNALDYFQTQHPTTNSTGWIGCLPTNVSCKSPERHRGTKKGLEDKEPTKPSPCHSNNARMSITTHISSALVMVSKSNYSMCLS